MLAFIITVIFCVTMFSAGISDARSMNIPNWSSLFILIAFFVVTPFVWQGWGVFTEHLMVGASVFLITFAMFSLNIWGAGDSKLMAATAFWWQWPDMLMYLFYTVFAGGALALCVILGILIKKFAPVPIAHSAVVDLVVKEGRDIPYALALGLGALATLPQSQIFLKAMGVI